jgi:hypothetical protein
MKHDGAVRAGATAPLGVGVTVLTCLDEGEIRSELGLAEALVA